MPQSNAIAESLVPIPGLRPELRHPRTGEVIRQTNLDEKLDELADAVRSRPWLQQVLRDVRAGHRTSIVTVSFGVLVLTTAVGASIELGLRHGRDLREIAGLLDEWSRRRDARKGQHPERHR